MIKRQAEALMPTEWGNFRMIAYAESELDRMPHIAFVHEQVDTARPVLTRIHSECITGDLFGSQRCDCGEQLLRALELAGEQKGAIMYLRQEGRGIGIINKLKAYNLQDEGLNTIDANTHLGFEVDARHYDPAIFMLQDLGIQSIELLTNNPLKISALETSDIDIASRIPLIIPPKERNSGYLKTKADMMGHLFY